MSHSDEDYKISMSESEKIKTALERQTKVVELRASMGRGTAVTTARMRNGLTVDVEEGPYAFTVDASEKWGGNNEGPNPGVYGRGALASCLAQAYIMWAAMLDVPLSSLEIQVHADYDTRGLLGVGDHRPAYEAVRYVVSLESTASKEEIERMLATAEANCVYLDVFANGVPVTRELDIKSGVK